MCTINIINSILKGLLVLFYYLIKVSNYLVYFGLGVVSLEQLYILYCETTKEENITNNILICCILISLIIGAFFANAAAMKYYTSQGEKQYMLKISIGIGVLNMVVTSAIIYFMTCDATTALWYHGFYPKDEEPQSLLFICGFFFRKYKVTSNIFLSLI